MALDSTQSFDIIEAMENYISRARPHPEIRHKIDIGYETTGQSVILFEIRPMWNNPAQKQKTGYAKATFVHTKDNWKIFWKRADLKWHSYDPKPTVRYLEDFLNLVDEDKYGCFKG